MRAAEDDSQNSRETGDKAVSEMTTSSTVMETGKGAEQESREGAVQESQSASPARDVRKKSPSEKAGKTGPGSNPNNLREFRIEQMMNI